jgi:Putative zinc-finger
MNHPNEEQFVSYYFRDVSEKTRWQIEEHLRHCPACRSELSDLERMLEEMAAIAPPERPADYEQRVWNRLRAQLPDRPANRWADFFAFPRLAYGGALAALVLAAFLIGRYWRPTTFPTASSISGEAHQRILLTALGNHLERSQMLLTEFMNAGGEGSVDITIQQQWARDLLDSNRLYRQAAVRNGDVGVAEVLDELERTLLQIAHSPDKISARDLHTMQDQIGARGILFKVRVMGSQLQERAKASRKAQVERT